MQHELIDKVFDLNKYGAGVTKEITTNSHLIKLPIHPPVFSTGSITVS